MRTEVIQADTIGEAVEEILDELKEDPNTSRNISSRNNVIYFDGWDGLGASAVLRAIAQRLTSTSKEKSASAGSSVSAGLKFEQIIHIDCSKWKSRRSLQRAVAEQLKLPAEVMEMFDRQDEEDDYRGVVRDSRAELGPVTRLMYQHMQKLNRRFLVIFHNGSNEEIDLDSCCGLPLSGYTTNKLLWTFQGRFRLKPQVKVDSAIKSAGTTDTFISACPDEQDPNDLWSYLVREEAVELVAAHKINTGSHGIIDQHAQVVECFLYMLELCWRGRPSINYDLATHIANYWICDGAIKHPQLAERDIRDYDDNDGLWRTAEALQREIQLDMEYQHQDTLPLHLARWVEMKSYWTSPTCGVFPLIPTNDLFQNYLDKLCVLKLSRWTFNFPSPPFLYCHNLRFLWLDHCQVLTSDGAREEEQDDISGFFQRLWVLDVRYTKGCNHILSARMIGLMIQLRELNVVGARDWDMGQLQGRLPNVRKLRVKECTLLCSGFKNDFLLDMNKMEFLDFSGNGTTYGSLCGPGVGNNECCLETVIVDTCYGFSKISLRGCTNLKNILLRGRLWPLVTLDISSTAVKTLDLTTTRIEELNELYLLDCEKLCAIMWPPADKRPKSMGKLRIDTTRGGSGMRRSSSLPVVAQLDGRQVDSDFDWYISVRDARLLGSLEPVYPTDPSSSRKIYLEISSPTVDSKTKRIIQRSDMHQREPAILRLQQTAPASIYADIGVDHLHKASNDEVHCDAPGTMCMWPCPGASRLPKESCYMHIQDQRGTEQAGVITVPDFVVECAKILHVRDSLSITVLPSAPGWGSEWHALEWCRIERCPRLDCVFGPEHLRDVSFEYKLRIFWASQLPKARYIWKWSEAVDVYRGFPDLTSLYLDRCPRLIHVFPISVPMLDVPHEYGFQCLETLEIMWCGDLTEVFPLDVVAKYNQEQRKVTTLDFPKLKRIHLHELPKLRGICDPVLRMSAPELETVKIRGCWSLKRLPIVQKAAVLCDCEKEWWDSLEWEDPDPLQKKLYRPIHSKYYKKTTLLRGSVLR